MRIDGVGPYWDLNGLSQIKDSSGTARAFEEELLHLYLKEVEKEFEESPLFGGGMAGKIYADLFAMELSRTVASTDSIGIRQVVEEAIRRYSGEDNG
ncbi:MAG: hypothetical protein GXO19_06595 [Epsilonproteobacteria bacterium]|nr:hypothetical protein [Campylobacterota bacterium]NPA57386.1 hypothetical protein [Campylobacterota bacterium]